MYHRLVVLCFAVWALTFAECVAGTPRDTHYDLYIDPSMAVASTFEAIDEWESATDVRLHIVITSSRDNCGDDATICLLPTDLKTIVEMTGANPNTIGFTHHVGPSDSSWVFVAMDFPFDQRHDELRQVVEHELGHAFGLVHSGYGTIMCYSTGCASLHITCQDVANYYELRDDVHHGCVPNRQAGTEIIER